MVQGRTRAGGDFGPKDSHQRWRKTAGPHEGRRTGLHVGEQERQNQYRVWLLSTACRAGTTPVLVTGLRVARDYQYNVESMPQDAIHAHNTNWKANGATIPRRH